MTDLMTGITARRGPTARLTTGLLEAGDPAGIPVLFVHGNVSSNLFWQSAMLALPAPYRSLALDLRGFGTTDPAPVDATRGLRDFADDLGALLDALDLAAVHLVGWSMGGGVILQYLLAAAAAVPESGPGLAPGDGGVLNTMPPTPARSDDGGGGDPTPPTLCPRGAEDVIVPAPPLAALAYRGSPGPIPGGRGAEACPPQP